MSLGCLWREEPAVWFPCQLEDWDGTKACRSRLFKLFVDLTAFRAARMRKKLFARTGTLGTQAKNPGADSPDNFSYPMSNF